MLRIPVITDTSGLVAPAFSEIIQLDGANYQLSFRWNETAQLWVLDILTVDDQPIVAGIAIKVGVPLAHFPAYANAPPGLLIALDGTNQDLEAGRNDLGARVNIYYATAAEIT